jgi:hypothetical protein
MGNVQDAVADASKQILADYGLSDLDLSYSRLHPIAISLTLITVGLGELRLWPEFFSPGNNRYAIIARVLRQSTDNRFRLITLHDREEKALIVPNYELEDCIVKLLIALGCVDNREFAFDGPFSTSTLSAYDIEDLSMHARIKIAGRIRNLIEASCPEVFIRGYDE